MIVVEHLIRDAVNTIPPIALNSNTTKKPSFHWGNKKELNRYLQLKKEDAYPLIWLLPSKDNYLNNGKIAKRLCDFVISTRETRTELFNDQRYIKSFDLVLNPLTESLIKSLKVHKVSKEWEIIKYPNYTEETSENKTIDLWDAVNIKIEIEFKNNC